MEVYFIKSYLFCTLLKTQKKLTKQPDFKLFKNNLNVCLHNLIHLVAVGHFSAAFNDDEATSQLKNI